MRPSEIVERYFALLAAQDIDGLMSLYAETATFTLPIGTSLDGKEAVRAMHQTAFSSGWPTPVPKSIIGMPFAAAAECAAVLADGSIRETANFFSFDENGLIAGVGVYMRAV